jgi:hypothetical protein
LTEPENRQAQYDKFWILKTYYLQGILTFPNWFAILSQLDKLFIEIIYRESGVLVKILMLKTPG